MRRLVPKRLQALSAILFAAALAIVLLLVTTSGSNPIPGENGRPAAASPAQLLELARSLGHPIYWLGRQPGATIEVTHTSGDNTYVRYLTGGARVGDPRPHFVTVGTYLRGSALGGLLQVSSRPGHAQLKIAGGGLAVTSTGSTSVYLAYPGSDYQIEVYAPSAAQALSLVRSGRVQALNGTRGTPHPSPRAGPQGPTGPTGPRVGTGATGNNGAGGPAGANGATGATGRTGTTGATRTPGPAQTTTSPGVTA
jgi:hypothetical protein